MKRMGCTAATLLLASTLLAPGSAAAQGDPDLREILPYLMLVIDTSGSMERLPACACETPACEECLPKCHLPNVDGQPPTEPPNDPNGRQLKKNRWATTLEALTGTFNDFQCEKLARTSANGATFDVNYFTPYHQPWDCSTADTACAFSSVPATYQNGNGILDQYATRVRFGLMTFDGWDTYVGAIDIPMPASNFDIPRSNSVHGLWSYAGPKPINYPGCDVDYMMDTGARSAIAAEGSLISMNSCQGGGTPGGSPTCAAWCSSCDGDQTNINIDIQEALLSARPYGGTPIAASLDDLYYHLKNDVTDTFGGCRNRFALLVTDGEPATDYYEVGCNCKNEGDLMDPYRCCPGGTPCDPSVPRYDPELKKCPYPRSEAAARDLVLGRTGDPPMIERLFVVGMAVDDPNVLARLDLIADEGCTEDDCDTDNDDHDALFADDLDGLVQNLSAVINSLIEPISRSVPAFAAGNQDASIKQYQISTGFEVATEPGSPWTGVIERRRFGCDSAGDLVEFDLDNLSGDRFHQVLNNRAASLRNLKTAMPPSAGGEGWGATVPPLMNAHLFRGDSNEPCGTSGCPMAAFTTGLHPLNFGLTATDTTRRDQIVNWMRGDASSPRANKKLGDIYHSSPVVVGSPRFDTADEAFNLFRQRPDIIGRPLTMYVGTNDGILHAFSIEAYTTPANITPQKTYVAGEEMWGFVPPIVLDDVEDNIAAGRLWSMDGTPVVKNVYFNRVAGHAATANEYHTVLITGMRQGGSAYIALDVTNPMNPQFLWQFTDPQMGLTFAQPAIAQARYKVLDQNNQLVDRNGAVAILPGGVGQAGALTGDCNNGLRSSMPHPTTSSAFETLQDTAGSGVLEHRSDVRCWREQGRALYFVEVATGRLIKKIYMDPDAGNKRVFPSPLVGTPAIYQADVGTLTTQAYVVDADGVIWRIDMSDPDPQSAKPMDGWTARPFHDIFWGRGPADGELTYEAPVLSVDNDGRVVVIVGTGDNNNFVKTTVQNRVVSLTEVRDTSVTGTEPERFRAAMNWEMRVNSGSTGTRLVASELVTGTMGLFNGTLFFGTFIAITGADACDMGKGRIHAVHYLNRDGTSPNDGGKTYPPILMNEVATDASAAAINIAPEDAVDNLMLMGLGLTQRPSCTVVDPDQTFDVWGQDLTPVTSLADPAIYLVAQGSGDRSATSLLQQRQGSNLGSVELRIDKPSTLSRVVSWATSTD